MRHIKFMINVTVKHMFDLKVVKEKYIYKLLNKTVSSCRRLSNILNMHELFITLVSFANGVNV